MLKVFCEQVNPEAEFHSCDDVVSGEGGHTAILFFPYGSCHLVLVPIWKNVDEFVVAVPALAILAREREVHHIADADFRRLKWQI